MTISEQVLLVNQYRHPIEAWLDELPAGLLDVEGEQPLLAAQRELAEEARTTADEWHVLVDLYTSPGMSNEAMRVFLARGLHRGSRGRAVCAGQRGAHPHPLADPTRRGGPAGVGRRASPTARR